MNKKGGFDLIVHETATKMYKLHISKPVNNGHKSQAVMAVEVECNDIQI